MTERVMGKFFWSDQRQNKEYQDILGTSHVRKDIQVCERCGITVDFLWRGRFPEEAFRERLAFLREQIAQEKCGNHHLPPH